MRRAKRRSLSVLLSGFAQGWLLGRRAWGGLLVKVVVLGVPLRARTAHIVQVRPVGAAGFTRSAPEFGNRLGQITPHRTLPKIPMGVPFSNARLTGFSANNH